MKSPLARAMLSAMDDPDKKLRADLTREAEQTQKRLAKEAERDLKRLAEVGKKKPKGKPHA